MVPSSIGLLSWLEVRTCHVTRRPLWMFLNYNFSIPGLVTTVHFTQRPMRSAKADPSDSATTYRPHLALKLITLQPIAGSFPREIKYLRKSVFKW